MRNLGKREEKSKPRLIVLPFQPQEERDFDGIGLGVHFLLGNVVAMHTGLREFWFGWRAAKIFPERERLKDYCQGDSPGLDITTLAGEQEIRYWLQGKVEKQGTQLQVALELKDTGGRGDQWSTRLKLASSDLLVGFRKGFLEWLANCGLSLADSQRPGALWPEEITFEGLDFLGRDLEVYYFYTSWDDQGPPASGLFDSVLQAAPASYLANDLKGWVLYKNKKYEAARESFLKALSHNRFGLGAMAGLMWCARASDDSEEAATWAASKAALKGPVES